MFIILRCCILQGHGYKFFLEHAGELRIFILRRNAQNWQVQSANGGKTYTGILHGT
jgi:hypothetical protein